MGKLIIELPLKVNRHYQLNDGELAEALLEFVESKARRIKNKPSQEDVADIRSAKRARAKGEFIAWEDVKAFLDL